MRQRIGLAVLSVVLAVAGFSGHADAVSCAADAAWDPKPSVSNANPCGAGDYGTPGASFIADGITFELWDKDEAPGSTTPTLDDPRNGGFKYFVTEPVEVAELDADGNGTAGYWFWNATNSLAEGNDTFAMVLKGGHSDADPVRWAWFILDDPVGATSTWLDNPITAGECAGSAGGFEFTHCGTWSMYGQDGTIKSVSHISIYGAQVAEPGLLIVLGMGLGVIALVAYRRTAEFQQTR